MLNTLTFEEYINHADIEKKVSQIAESISDRYHGKTPLFLVIMNGAFMFAADLIRHLNFAAEVVFIRVKSYHGTQSSGNINISISDKVAAEEYFSKSLFFIMGTYNLAP